MAAGDEAAPASTGLYAWQKYHPAHLILCSLSELPVEPNASTCSCPPRFASALRSRQVGPLLLLWEPPCFLAASHSSFSVVSCLSWTECETTFGKAEISRHEDCEQRPGALTSRECGDGASPKLHRGAVAPGPCEIAHSPEGPGKRFPWLAESSRGEASQFRIELQSRAELSI